MSKSIVKRPRPSDEELLAVEEFAVARRSGERVSVASFLRRHPECSETMRPALEGIVLFERELRRSRTRQPGARLPGTRKTTRL
ncbi:MAG TPA: hypothetical protein ENN51_01960 [candidate division WOR-3 bacterium]|uniref:Uncharacterized protein n=1 Tax=candidate division WOR-3 bacterium TaxID=2052148 RepID=A0A7V0T4Y9_UNCW3|nr:hypothetical protein [candidate division WOR-3 bacterium]